MSRPGQRHYLRLAVPSFLALASAGVWAATSGDPLQVGTAAYAKGDYDQAIEAFDAVIAAEPRSEQAYLFLGKCWLAKKNYAMAECDFGTAIALDPKNAEACKCRGDAYLQEGDFGAATCDYTQALQLKPGFAEAQQALASVQNAIDAAVRKKQQAEEDQELVKKTTEEDQQARNPKSDQLCAEGMGASLKGDLDTAIADFTKAIDLNPRNVAAYFGRANAYVAKREYDNGIGDWDRVIQLHPFFPLAYCCRSDCYILKGDVKKALADAERAVHLDPDSDQTFFFRGLVYFRMRDFDKAIADFSQSLHPDPKVADALRDPAEPPEKNIPNFASIELTPRKTHLWRGNAYLNRWSRDNSASDLDSAIADFREEIRQSPNDADAHVDLINVLENKGDREGAMKALKHFADSVQGNDAQGSNALAWTLATSPDPLLRDGIKALDFATRACRLTGWKDTNIVDTYAAASAEDGNFDDAVKWENVYLATPNLTPKLKAEAQARLALYQAHQPYHEKEPGVP